MWVQDMSVEHFEGGSAFGLKDITITKSIRRTMNFYHTCVFMPTCISVCNYEREQKIDSLCQSA